ncbi:MAG: ROK family protein [Actinobacteria bacterium]|nr:ROK family protein [Thermoleophilia bacterium]MCB9010867.1 ROK family protein [Actinomycetota bacterium]
MIRAGVDIGGTGIKSALVDTRTGELTTPRLRTPTPAHSTPEAVCAVVAEQVRELMDTHHGEGTVGIGIPAVVQHGVIQTAAHLDASWVGVDAEGVLSRAVGRDIVLLNDADLAGVAETRLGVAKDTPGVILMLTLGTGIGSAMFVDGVLVPNLELGHIEIRGKAGESRAAASVRERKELSWSDWIERLNEYLDRIEQLVWPDVIVLGGGITRKSEKFADQLVTRAELRIAALRNHAGIVGGALLAADHDRAASAG